MLKGSTRSDAGISGAKGRDGRRGLDQMLKDASRRKFDVIMAWSIDRVGRSLIDLLGTIQTLEACGVDLYLDQQSIDTTTPAGKLMFQVCGAFAEFERSMIRQRINAGLKRAVAQGKQLGRPKVDPAIEKRIQAQLRLGKGMQRSRVSAASAPARCSALSRRWKALSSARPREVDSAQMKPKRVFRIRSGWLLLFFNTAYGKGASTASAWGAPTISNRKSRDLHPNL
jgi:DNA invertase Pin-like site-specific DNA recombinase